MPDALDTQLSYDKVAAEYAARYGAELTRKPFDCKMLDWLIEKVGGCGEICDMGCGPGQVAGYLHRRGSPTCGIDLSPEMVKQAQQLHPQIEFQCGNMLALMEIADNAFGGMAAFYTLIHIAPTQIPQALQELKRVLRPSGVLLATFHIGNKTIHWDEWWAKSVNLDFNFYTTDWFTAQLRTSGFVITEAIERDPYPETVEFQSRRAYIFAQKPATDVS